MQITEDESQILLYTEWGVIDPKGKAINGRTTPGASLHTHLVRKYGFLRLDDAIEKGWVRWYCDDGDLTFSFFLTPTTAKNIINFIGHQYWSVPERYVLDGDTFFYKSDSQANIAAKLRGELQRMPIAASYEPVGRTLVESIRYWLTR